MFSLPTTILIDNVEYKIRNKGDYRVIQDCFSALNDLELEHDYRIITSLIIFYECLNDINDIDTYFNTEDKLLQAIKEMFNFFNCNDDNVGANKPYKLIDWEKDEQLIVSSINSVAYKEIRSESYIHWWTFMGYFSSIGECLFSRILNIREKIVKGKKLEKYEREFKNENPQYFTWEWKTSEQLAQDKLLLEMWEN